jgi:hypothetical protein
VKVKKEEMKVDDEEEKNGGPSWSELPNNFHRDVGQNNCLYHKDKSPKFLQFYTHRKINLRYQTSKVSFNLGIKKVGKKKKERRRKKKSNR